MANLTPERVIPAAGPQSSQDFENPPVVETSSGFHFLPVQGWTILQYGLLWEKFRTKYPLAEFNPPVGEVQFALGPGMNFSNTPVRVSFVDSSSTNLAQVQNNFILHNWRRSDSSLPYQHYTASRSLLVDDWHIYREFLAQQSLKFTEVIRCETSYFNHLVRGEDWQDFSELPKIYPAWKGTGSDGVLSNPQMISIGAWYLRPSGLLQIGSQPGLRKSDGKDIIQLTVTATSSPSSQDDDALFACLDACHQTAVEGFAEFTSEELHPRWRRIR
jgi:uncharacterized protein (TIGR04255 family)